MILFIFEGKNDEPRIYKTLKKAIKPNDRFKVKKGNSKNKHMFSEF